MRSTALQSWRAFCIGLFAAGVVCSVFSSPAYSCSEAACIGGGIETKVAFRVAITFDNRPLPGALIEISGNGGVANFKTAVNGTARVTGLSPGQYWLTAKFLGITAAYRCFHIKQRPSEKAKSKLKYTWGDEPPTTQQLAGKLLDSQPGKGEAPIMNLIHRVDVPIGGASLTLHDPINGTVFEMTSDDQGQFNFGSLPNGTYALHIEGGKAGDRDYDSTDQLIALDARSIRKTVVFLHRDAGAGSCGGTSLELRDH